MAAVAIVALFVVILIAVLIAGLVFARGSGRSDPLPPLAADHDELRYPVPDGIDPATVMATLHHHGYHAFTDIDEHNQPVVVITGDAGSLDRERIRAELRSVPFNESHDPAGLTEIRFADE